MTATDHIGGRVMTATHGPTGPSANTYKHGCRCPECTKAQRLKQQAIMADLASRPRDQVPHGRYGYSNWSCRCETCSGAWSRSEALNRARRKQGTGKRLTEMEAAAIAAAEQEAQAS